MIAWQPIASAPLDGSFVLLRGGHIDPYHTDERSKNPPFVAAYWWNKWGNDHGAWIVTDYDGGAARVSYDEATEWADTSEILGGAE